MNLGQLSEISCTVRRRHLELSAEPGEALRKLTGANQPFFLDSAATHGSWGRFSYLGYNPLLSLSFDRQKGAGLALAAGLGGSKKMIPGNPWRVLEQLCSILKSTGQNPRDQFQGGWVGYLSYDLGRYIERLPELAAADISLPELRLGLYNCWAMYDHQTGRWSLCALEFPASCWLDGGENAGQKMDRLEQALTAGVAGAGEPAGDFSDAPACPRCNFTEQEYLRAVGKAREYIAAGDIFQVNLSQRFTVPLRCSPVEAYLQLRKISPAWFAAYMQWDDQAVLSSSPELFLRRTGRTVITRPIKGTRPRRSDQKLDARMRQELADSPKDMAELNMIVDLERNDLGRVCRYGSVRVVSHHDIEAHPTVYHLVSTVTGELAEGISTVDLLRATFPGGSISGAPKVRAMQIIEELEPTRRSVYTGAIGYIGLDGSCQFNVAIRTIMVDGPYAHCQVGGAVVADSQPQAEYQETLDKGLAMMAAVRNMPLSQMVFK